MVLRCGVLECVPVWHGVEACLNVYMYGMALRRARICTCMVLRRGVLECVPVWYYVVTCLNVYMYDMSL